jgi:hypothetical protein
MNFKDATLLRQAALVGGDWIAVRSDNAIAVDNPATGEVIGSALDLGSIETKRAIAALVAFERDPIPYALETDWPVGAAGFEALHLRIGIGPDSQFGAGESNHAHLD